MLHFKAGFFDGFNNAETHTKDFTPQEIELYNIGYKVGQRARNQYK